MDPTQPAQLQAKIAQLAARYLDRVPGEVELLHDMIGQAAAGTADNLGDIEALAHRIHGGGAMLRFEEISNAAGVLERLTSEARDSGTADFEKMNAAQQALKAAVEKACAQRG